MLFGTIFKYNQSCALILQVSILQVINTKPYLKEKASPLLLELLCVIWELLGSIRLILSIWSDTGILKSSHKLLEQTRGDLPLLSTEVHSFIGVYNGC